MHIKRVVTQQDDVASDSFRVKRVCQKLVCFDQQVDLSLGYTSPPKRLDTQSIIFSDVVEDPTFRLRPRNLASDCVGIE